MISRRLSRGLAGAAICALAMTGCSSSPDSDSKDKDSTSQDGGGKDGAKPGVEDVDPDDVIVKQDVKVPGSKEDTVTVGIHSLEVKGKTQTLTVVITPHFKSVADDDVISIYDTWGENRFFPQLIDADNLKVYSPISDTYEEWTADSVYTETTNNQPMTAWAVFKAPENDIDSVDIRLQESWPKFTDIPVTES
ncbi:hypothetical protein D3I60_16030 [Brevibacterium permense]|uniref:hypothetical protein n=1 Tax=Brevibacterium permense TaxID=234834 RepID=UPI0021D291EB|nr:hypothetical protein [Brevibacterium permense]MCU4298564.1 hypothetical protein [Brevibacterium permense]